METKTEQGVLMVKSHDGWHRADEKDPRIFYFSVAKFASGMTREELDREIESAECNFALYEESGCGISTKEIVRYRDCVQALADLRARS